MEEIPYAWDRQTSGRAEAQPTLHVAAPAGARVGGLGTLDECPARIADGPRARPS
jgi:hypothetical protein